MGNHGPKQNMLNHGPKNENKARGCPRDTTQCKLGQIWEPRVMHFQASLLSNSSSLDNPFRTVASSTPTIVSCTFHCIINIMKSQFQNTNYILEWAFHNVSAWNNSVRAGSFTPFRQCGSWYKIIFRFDYFI